MVPKPQIRSHPNSTIDPNSGFCSRSRTFHSLRPNVPLPPPSQLLSVAEHALSLLPATASNTSVVARSNNHERLKELMKYKAYQVPPAELEHILYTNPEIADVAVVPYPDENAGQIPMAFVVRKLGSSITADQVMEFVAKQVTPYKKIRRVAFISAIPKSPAGKILRRELVDYALSNGSSKL